MDLDKIIKILESKNTELNLAIDSYSKSNKRIKEENEIQLKWEKIKNLIIEIGKKSQAEVLNYIEETVTHAVKIFGEEYSFKIEFEVKREQPEIRFLVGEDRLVYEPRNDTTSGGVIDVIAFALQIILWSLEKPQSIPILMLDEPQFKNIDIERLPKFANLVSELCHKMEIQIIMVSHIEPIIDVADNVIEI